MTNSFWKNPYQVNKVNCNAFGNMKLNSNDIYKVSRVIQGLEKNLYSTNGHTGRRSLKQHPGLPAIIKSTVCSYKRNKSTLNNKGNGNNMYYLIGFVVAFIIFVVVLLAIYKKDDEKK